MLKAFINNKYTKIHLNEEAFYEREELFLDWRDLYSKKEDLLTSTIIGRLPYLEGNIVTELINQSFAFSKKGRTLPAPEGDIEVAEFWPKWGNQIPDFYFEYTSVDGTPVSIIGESKTQGTQQPDQIARQRYHYFKHKNKHNSAQVWSIGVGGLPTSELYKIERKVESLSQEDSDSFFIAFLSWENLLKESAKIKEKQNKTRCFYIIKDIVDGLALNGVHEKKWLKDINHSGLPVRKESFKKLISASKNLKREKCIGLSQLPSQYSPLTHHSFPKGD